MKDLKKLLRQIDKVTKANSYSDIVSLNSEERLYSRLDQLEINIDAAKDGENLDQIGLERLVGANNLMDINYFKKGLAFAKKVCRVIQITGKIRQAVGSGFLVGPNLLMTNNHVIPDPNNAHILFAEFEYEHDDKGKLMNSYSFELNPDRFFITNERLDYTIVGVKPIAINNSNYKLKDLGTNLLKPISSKLIIGESLSIIQHPDGNPKMIAIRDNKVVDLDKTDVYYTTDTQRGSSGSPVANEQWEIVALHKAGVPDKNKAGKVMRIDGKVFKKGDSLKLIHWVANKGTLIDTILEDIYTQTLPEKMQKIKKKLLEAYKLPPGQSDYQLPD